MRRIGVFTMLMVIFSSLMLLSSDVSAASKLSASVMPESKMSGAELVAALKQGGYSVYFRHSSSDRSQKDTDHKNLNNCDTQRNLTEEGRVLAKEIGKHMHDLGIEFSEILSSPYCRCVDTAMEAFGRVEKSDGFQFSSNAAKPERDRRKAVLRNFLGTLPPEGKNNVVIAHTGNLKDAMMIWPKPEGVVIVFKPLGGSEAEFMGQILPDQWGSFH